MFFSEQTPEALREAIDRFEEAETCFEPPRLRRWAERFAPDRFDEAFDRELEALKEAET